MLRLETLLGTTSLKYTLTFCLIKDLKLLSNLFYPTLDKCFCEKFGLRKIIIYVIIYFQSSPALFSAPF